MKKYKPNSYALIALQILSFLICIALTALDIIYLDRFKTLMIIILCALWTLTVVLSFLLLPIYFNRSVFYLSPTELGVHTFFIVSNRSSMRLSSVQYFSVTRFPLSKLLGLNFITVHGMGGSVLLPFLSYDDSEAIVDTLQEEISSRNS